MTKAEDTGTSGSQVINGFYISMSQQPDFKATKHCINYINLKVWEKNPWV